MDIRKSAAVGLLLGIVSAAAVAQHYPGGADLMRPGGTFPGTPDYGASGGAQTQAAPKCFGDFDREGKGYIVPADLDPGSQLFKRFATRDKNGDGQLTRDEYAFVC